MEAAKCISTSITEHTTQNQLTIDDLNDDSLGIIFNKLAYIDRMRIDSVCKRWYAVSKATWCIYSNHLRIDEDTAAFSLSDNNTAEKKNILKKILQRSGSYLEEITFKPSIKLCDKFTMGTIKWIAELCPKLKRLNTGNLMLNDADWLACSNLEALSLSFCRMEQKVDGIDVLFRRNKRLRRLEIFNNPWLSASDFEHLEAGQLECLWIECCFDFKFAAEIIDKFAESLVELRYTCGRSIMNLQHLWKLKNLRSLDLVGIEKKEIKFIADIAKNCQKLERVFLSIIGMDEHYEHVFAPLLALPHLRRLVVIVTKSNIFSSAERDELLQKATHLEFFVIEKCVKCAHLPRSSNICNRHGRDWLW